MPLENGTRLGPYEITGQLGAGGMGEVCRARDTKLNREVALKVLPAAFASDPERMARFHREAQVLATLNHPHIATIYGFEEGPAESGGRSINAIVMELVEGETLAAQIERGPIPLDEALQFAKQIAEALEYAHDRGVIHRDLKPANVKVTPDGAVKVLDFGLAKALGDSGDSAVDLAGSMSPTLSLAATYAGVILGTAAYMAPEQAKAKGADRRADVWAFGVVLYEMLTGSRMFGGDSVAETLASVMKEQLTFASLPPDTPKAVRRLISRCLERDLRRRLQSIGEARIVIEDVIAGAQDDEGPSHAPAMLPSTPASRWPWMVAGVAALAAIAAGGWTWSRPAPPLPAVAQFTTPPPEGTSLTSNAPNASQLAVSPDGRYVAFIADEAGRDRTIWVRALDSLVAQRLDRTEGATFPFWSPDSRHIAYFVQGKLMRVPVAGGAPLPISDAPAGEGGTWFQEEGQEGTIVFAPDVTGPLHRVPAQGGISAPITSLGKGETAHSFPQSLPDGRFLYLAEGDRGAIYVHSPGSSQPTFVVESTGRAMFSPPGLLLYLRENTLLAHRWNLDTLKLEGEPVTVVDGVRSGGANGRNAFSISANGVLAYRAGNTAATQVTWYTREGKPDGVVLDPGEFGPIELSPDDTRFVVVRSTGDDRDLWLKDLTSGVFTRLTSAAGPERDPVWSPDSRRIAYVAGSAGSDSTLHETLIGSGKHTVIPGSFPALNHWTQDGKYLVAQSGRAISLVPAPQEGAPVPGKEPTKPIFDEKYTIDQLRVSPDGRWVAYASQESGQPEIVVAAFPAFTDRRQISSGGSGAVQPLWRADGRELLFLGRDQILRAVEVKDGETLQIGPVRTLFRTGANQNAQVHMYAVTRDGTRFLIREPAGSATDIVEPLYVVLNWTSLVRR